MSPINAIHSTGKMIIVSHKKEKEKRDIGTTLVRKSGEEYDEELMSRDEAYYLGREKSA